MMRYSFTGRTFFSAAFFLSVSVSHAALAATNYSIQNDLSGATSVMASANYGAGVVFGVIDTGIVPQWLGFTPTYNGQGVYNIDTVNSALCIGTCPTGAFPTDMNGHGTFAASEIVGGVQTANANMSGVARAGTLFAVQVLSASGSGYATDTANGIRYAADHGAQVLNLSLGPSGSPLGQVAFYQSLASAINYAASKGVYVVFAGGNSSKNLVGGFTITGFTDAAIQHMLFMGSTNASKKLSKFSNKPGSGSFLSTTGVSYAYKDMWLMGDGENIWGASISNTGQCAGYGCITQMSGTSMSAPQGAGAIGLLIARWPILITNGTAARVLEQTGTDLGTIGVDTSYGSGFLNLIKAFQPVGGTYAVTGSGGTVSISQTGSSALASGALGALSRLSSALSNYTIFDSFQRDFAMNLSGLVSTRSSPSQAAQNVTAPKTTVSTTRFTDGSRLSFGSMDDYSPLIDSNNDNSRDRNWFMSFTDVSGATLAAGAGFPASASFASALWGNDGTVSDTVYSLGVSNALMNLAQGGSFLAYGNQLSGDTRMAFSWTTTQEDTTSNADWTRPNAKSFGTGITTSLTDFWKAGLTFGLLDEQSGMLGTTYATSGPLSLGDDHKSVSFGVSSVFALGDNRSLLIDAAIARSDGALANGLITSVTPLYARSFGAALVQHDSITKGDNLSFSVRSPLRVYSGSASLATTSVDGNGVSTTGIQRVNLAPNGNELDFSIGYAAPVSDDMSWNISVGARRDADNVRGNNDADILIGTKIRF